MKKLKCMMAIGLSLALLAAGCRPSVAEIETQERMDADMRRAAAAEQAGKVGEATALYEQLTLVKPAMALPHLYLAQLKHDVDKDYISALYHYDAYLRLRPDAEKVQLVARLRADAREQLAKQMRAGYDPGTLTNRLTQLESQLGELARENAGLLRERRSLEEKVASQLEAMETLRRRLRIAEAELGRDRIAPASTIRQIGHEETVRQTYRVKKGDTLMALGKMFYGDAAKWTRIRDANRDMIPENNELREGQMLVIP